ncbi:hypothetical protein FA15DRAFT_631880 [Coprinopsis marcescibilis]|uniref:Clp1-like protein n=1 Tax=Coprinopsis marcescibilis TaxID=230819 RepID=A0A5C3LBZ5_COPMA|nr:hypothetical protein FA15DRAFT_631880 [Coprinopsis marcescibilis]
MFQVASHPPSFNMHAHGHPANMSHPSPSVQLPRSLARPPFAEVSRDAIMAAAPELGSVPAEYIRRGLRPKANEMLAGIAGIPRSALPTSITRSHLPSLIPVAVTPTHPQPTYPTHALAVSSSKTPSGKDSLMIFPVHSLVLASHCSSLPRLPQAVQPSGNTLNLPVLPLALPSPAAFTILHQFMYHHRLDAVLKALFPLPSAFLHNLSHHTVQSTLASGTLLHQLSTYLCSSASSNLTTLTTHAAHVKELWQDMVALGLHDPELWDTIDLAWEVVLGALNLAAAQR